MENRGAMKSKWRVFFSVDRSFVGIVVRASVRASFLLPSKSLSPFAPPFLYIATLARSFLTSRRGVFATAGVRHRRLFNTERARRRRCRSSWPYATTKSILKITFEFRVCALHGERERERGEREGGREREREKSENEGRK